MSGNVHNVVHQTMLTERDASHAPAPDPELLQLEEGVDLLHLNQWTPGTGCVEIVILTTLGEKICALDVRNLRMR